MTKVGLWHIQQEKPVRLSEVQLDLEKHLEDWIENDPGLVQNGMVIINRQLIIESGRLDLLALDPLGRFVVIEIKAGAVGPETITQAIFYSAIISRMPASKLHPRIDQYLKSKQRNTTIAALLQERGVDPKNETLPREMLIMLVGTYQSSGMSKVAEYLIQDYKFPLTIVTFDIHQTATGEQILSRELTDADTAVSPSILKTKKPTVTMEDLARQAEANGTGHLFRQIWAAANRHGLYTRTWPTAVMYTAPQNHTKMLFTVWTSDKRRGILKTYVGYSAFADYYPISEEDVGSFLGPEGWRHMDQAGVDEFIRGLDQLFARI